jgi:anaerobic ribonucleoside-triphosphate reductase activating protein
MSDVLLNVSNIVHRSQVNGPGLRSVVWVQGCTLACPGCFNLHTHPHKPVKLVDPQELGRELIALPDTEGLTISGGEPFQQADACAVLAATMQGAGRSVMVFSGYPYGYLSSATDRDVVTFLRSIDILVAGPYVEHLKTDGRSWLASANQELIFLTDRYKISSHGEAPEEAIVEIKGDGHAMQLTGFPDKADLQWLQNFSRRCEQR